MKITCEHCRGTIDVENDKKCPNCGASYSNNKEYKEMKEYHKKMKDYNLKEREINIKNKEMASEIIEKQFKGQRVVVIISLLVFFGILAFMIFGITSTVSNRKGNTTPINGVYNEFVGGKQFEIKCDGIKKIDSENFMLGMYKPKENHAYYSFHILFKHKNDEWFDLDKINLSYIDDSGNEDIKAEKIHSMDGLNGFAMEQITYNGDIIFEIPDYVRDVKIKAENVTIDIKDFRENLQ